MTIPALLALLALAADPSQRVLHAVPEDARLLVAAYDLDGLRARWSENAWGQLLGGEALAPLRAELSSKAEESLEELDAEVDFAALVASIHGSACYYQALGQVASDPFRMGMLVEPGSPREAFDGLLAQAIERLRASALAEGTTESAGATVRFFVLPAEPARGAESEEGAEDEIEAEPTRSPASEPPAERAVHYVVLAERDGLVALAFGDHKDGLIEEVLGALARWSAREGGLHGSSALASARASQGRTGALEAFVAVSALVERGSEQPDLHELLQAVSFVGMDWIHATADVGAGEALDASIAIAAAEDGFWRPLLAGMRPAPLELAGAVPPSAKTIGLYGFDLLAALASLRDVLGRKQPEMLEQLEEGLAQAKAFTGLDVEKDVLASLGHGLVQMAMAVPPEEARGLLDAEGMQGGGEPEDPEEREALEQVLVEASPLGQAWLLSLADRARFETVLAKVMELAGVEPASAETLAGAEVRSVAMGPLALRYVLRDDLALFSLSPSALSAALGQLPLGRATSIADEPRIGAALREHADASFLSVGRTADSLRLWVSTLGGLDVLPVERDELPSDEELAQRFRGTLRGGTQAKGSVLRFFFSAR